MVGPGPYANLLVLSHLEPPALQRREVFIVTHLRHASCRNRPIEFGSPPAPPPHRAHAQRPRRPDGGRSISVACGDLHVHPTAMPQTPRTSMLTEVLAGLVERVTFHNDENGFCVVRVKARGQRDLITVLGHAADELGPASSSRRAEPGSTTARMASNSEPRFSRLRSQRRSRASRNISAPG
jgi:hypothetical protein